jgi:hypothetical protein
MLSSDRRSVVVAMTSPSQELVLVVLQDEHPQQLLVLELQVVVLEHEQLLHEVQLAAPSVSSAISISEISNVSASRAATWLARSMSSSFRGCRSEADEASAARAATATTAATTRAAGARAATCRRTGAGTAAADTGQPEVQLRHFLDLEGLGLENVEFSGYQHGVSPPSLAVGTSGHLRSGSA